MTDTIKCSGVDTAFAAGGPAVAVWEPGRGVIRPSRWMDLSGRPQSTPDRNTRGYIDAQGKHHWLDVFADLSGQPAQVRLASGLAHARSQPRPARPPVPRRPAGIAFTASSRT
jgi:hypothetical protein